jgi:hypothetical protein
VLTYQRNRKTRYAIEYKNSLIISHESTQPIRNYNLVLQDHIKEEVDWLLKAQFIPSCRYAKWVCNIVVAEKKNNEKIRVCTDFQNLNRATSKD